MPPTPRPDPLTDSFTADELTLIHRGLAYAASQLTDAAAEIGPSSPAFETTVCTAAAYRRLGAKARRLKEK